MNKSKLFLLLLPFLIGLAACATPTNARTVTLIADGETRTIATEAPTVRELLTEAEITLDEDDRVTPSEPTFIEDGMTIRVVRIEVRTETEQRELPFDRRTVRDASVPAGETKLLEPGVTGIEELTYRITLEDGVAVNRQLVREVTLQEPRTEVLLIGAQAEREPISISGSAAFIANHNAWIMRDTSLNQHRLTHSGDLDGRVFALSSDGSYLLFTRVPTATGESAPINTLWIIDTVAADAEPIRLTVTEDDPLNSVLWADWEPGCEVEPDGSACRIAYTTGARAEGNPGWKGNNDLWIARPRPDDGRLVGQRRLIEPTGGGAYGWWGTTYAWSPDGESLAYARADEVGLIRVYDGARTPLAHFPPYRTYAPWVWTPTVSWTPEGAFIATTLHGPSPTGEAEEDSPVFDIWTLAADGTLTAELSSEAGMWAAPTYAPQGDHILFGRARSPYASQASGYDLYLMDRDGSDRRRLFPPEGEIGFEYPEVAWGPKGERLLMVYQSNLYLLHITDGKLHQVTDEGGVRKVRWNAQISK